MKTTYTFNKDKTVTDIDHINGILDTAGGISTGETTITNFLVEVSKNQQKKKAYIDTLNHNNDTLMNDELKAFKGKVHKMVKLTNKKATQEAVLGKEKAKETKWTIRLAKSKDVEAGIAEEADKGKYCEFNLEIEPTPEKEAEALADLIVNWQEANEKGLAEEGRKEYVAQLVNAAQMLASIVALMPEHKK